MPSGRGTRRACVREALPKNTQPPFSQEHRCTNPNFNSNRRDRAPASSAMSRLHDIAFRRDRIPLSPRRNQLRFQISLRLSRLATFCSNCAVTSRFRASSPPSAPPAPQRPLDLYRLRRQRPIQILRRRQFFTQLPRIKFRSMSGRHRRQQLCIQFILPRRILPLPRDRCRGHRRQIPLQLVDPRRTPMRELRNLSPQLAQLSRNIRPRHHLILPHLFAQRASLPPRPSKNAAIILTAGLRSQKSEVRSQKSGERKRYAHFSARSRRYI